METKINTLNRQNLNLWCDGMDKKQLSAIFCVSLYPNGSVELHSAVEPEKIKPLLEKLLQAMQLEKGTIILGKSL